MRNICYSRKPDLFKPQGSGQDKLCEMVWALACQRSEGAVQSPQHEELNPSKQDRLSDGVLWNYTVNLGFFHPFQSLLPDLISKQPRPQTAPTPSHPLHGNILPTAHTTLGVTELLLATSPRRVLLWVLNIPLPTGRASALQHWSMSWWQCSTMDSNCALS